MALTFAPHPEIRARVDRIGLEQAPVLVVENFVRDSEALIEAAEDAFRAHPRTRSYFPGPIAEVPKSYAFAAFGFLLPAICDAFGVGREVQDGGCDFQILALPASQLDARQRIPHFDSPDAKVLASVHYLCPPSFLGTAFYRHNRTGFESVSPERLRVYETSLGEDLAAHPPAGYISGDTPIFTRIASYDAVFNRIILFRGCSLHSGLAAADHAEDRNPRTGRLTANMFLHFKR